MMNTPPRKNTALSKTAQTRTEFGWKPALRFIENGFGLGGKNRHSLDDKNRETKPRISMLDAGTGSREIALHLLRVYRVRQAVEETLEGLVYLIDDLQATDEPAARNALGGLLAARNALGGLLAGSVSDAVQYYRQHAENKATYGNNTCRDASDYFANEAVLTFMRSLPSALKAGLLATQTDPSHQRAWEVYGTLQMCCGQFTAAEKSFSRAQALAA